MGIQIEARSRLIRWSPGLLELQQLGLVEWDEAYRVSERHGQALAGEYWAGPGSRLLERGLCTYAQHAYLCSWLSAGPWAEALAPLCRTGDDHCVWGPATCSGMVTALEELVESLEPGVLPAGVPRYYFDRPELDRILSCLLDCFRAGADGGLAIRY